MRPFFSPGGIFENTVFRCLLKWMKRRFWKRSTHWVSYLAWVNESQSRETRQMRLQPSLHGNLMPEYSRWSFSRMLTLTYHIIIFFAKGSVFAKKFEQWREARVILELWSILSIILRKVRLFFFRVLQLTYQGCMLANCILNAVDNQRRIFNLHINTKN